MSSKYSQKLLDHAKQSAATEALKTTSKRVIQKTAEANGDLIGNKIANRITKVSENSDQNNSETVTYEYDKQIYEKRYISSEDRHKIPANICRDEDIFKTSFVFVFRRHLQDIFKKS